LTVNRILAALPSSKQADNDIDSEGNMGV
jgi:hypothetical protein